MFSAWCWSVRLRGPRWLCSLVASVIIICVTAPYRQLRSNNAINGRRWIHLHLDQDCENFVEICHPTSGGKILQEVDDVKSNLLAIKLSPTGILRLIRTQKCFHLICVVIVYICVSCGSVIWSIALSSCDRAVHKRRLRQVFICCHRQCELCE